MRGTKYAGNTQAMCQKYAGNMQLYAKNMQVFANNMQEICTNLNMQPLSLRLSV